MNPEIQNTGEPAPPGITVDIDHTQLMQLLEIENENTSSPEEPELIQYSDNITSRGTNTTDVSRVACPKSEEVYRHAIGLYNMSVRKVEDGFSGIIRGSSWNGCCTHNTSPAFSYAYYINVNEDGSVRNLRQLNLGYRDFISCTKHAGDVYANGIEDSRLFLFKGEEWVIGNSLGWKRQQYPCINAMCIFKVKDPKNTFCILKPPEGVSPRQRQKNWSPFEYDGELYCEYGMEPHIILKIDPETGVTKEVYRTGAGTQDITAETSLRGGAPPILIINPYFKSGKSDKLSELDTNITQTVEMVKLDNKQTELPKLVKPSKVNKLLASFPEKFYLGVGHTRTRIASDYLHFFYIFEVEPPFRMLKITPQFKLDGKERIQFAAGLSEYDGMIYISYGVDDCYNRISRFELYDILSIMS